MERVARKFAHFIAAYNALQRAIDFYEKHKEELLKNEPEGVDVLITAIIKNFELVYETCWKFLKEYGELVHDYSAASPRAVIRGCLELRILPQELTDEFQKIIDIRNSTAHVYQAVLAREVGQLIETHSMLFKKIIDCMENKM